MKYADFKKSIDLGESRSIYLFEGEDVFFSNKGISLLKDTFVTEPELNFTVFSGDVTEKDLFSALSSYPFLSQKRITVIKEFYPNKDFLSGSIKEYFDNPFSNSLLIIQNLKTSDVLKKFPSVTVVDCSKADAQVIISWIKNQGKENGVIFPDSSARLICEYCLSDMTRISTETEKLISYALKTGSISDQDVEELVSKDTEYKVYELTDAIGKKQFEKAIGIVNDLLSKGETYQRLIVSIYNYFRRLLHVAISDRSNSQTAQDLGVKEFAVQKMKQQAGSFRIKALKNAVDMLSEADYKIKSGIIDDETAMWMSLFKIMTE